MTGELRDPTHLLELVALIRQSVDVVLQQDTGPHAQQHELDVSPRLPADEGRRREAVMILEGACAQLCATVAPPEHTMVNHAFAMVTPACLRVALEARVAEHLRLGQRSAVELGELTGVDAGKLARVLRHLALRQCFREVQNDVFTNTKLSECLLPDNATSALIGLYVIDVYPAFICLSDVLLDPEWTSSTDKEKTAFARAHGMHIFKLTETEPVRGAFAQSMHAQSQLAGGHALLIEYYPWAELAPGSTFCDVGGGTGAAALAILSAHSHLKAVVQDQPGTIKQAHLLWKDRAESGRVRLVPMDFFAEPPVEGCAVYYLKQILHDWPDADCAIILRNVRAAMTMPTSRLLIHDIVVDYHSSAAPFPLLQTYGVGAQRTYNMDMNMMATLNSRERTLAEIIALCAHADLKYVKVCDEAPGLSYVRPPKSDLREVECSIPTPPNCIPHDLRFDVPAPKLGPVLSWSDGPG